MKKILFSVLASLTVCWVANEVMGQPFPDWTATLRVVDESGQPIVGANVEIWYRVPPPTTQAELSEKISGLTDTNGEFRASHKYTTYSLDFRASKAGFYTTSRNYELGSSYDVSKWNPNITLALKLVGQPIPMYAKWVRQGPPVFNQPIGYDLMAGDWVAPNGKGKSADIVFTHIRDQKSPLDYEYTLKVSFPSSGDGIQEFTIPDEQNGSSLKSPHEAPENGYQAEITRVNVSHPPETAKMDYDPKRNYFFRVRTVFDERGTIKSALYGKIYGDFMKFTYYLNPRSNDRNVEFDPARNLLSGQSVPVP